MDCSRNKLKLNKLQISVQTSVKHCSINNFKSLPQGSVLPPEDLKKTSMDNGLGRALNTGR